MNNYKFCMHYLCYIHNRIRKFIHSKLTYLYAKIWGVYVGGGLVCNGCVKFRRWYNSEITIGTNCRFNNSVSSNWIGVYIPCIISTISERAILQIGDSCGFSGVVIGCAKKIIIGKNVMIGANTLITDSDWHWDDNRLGDNKEVIIGDNVFIGTGTKILKGVHIGENSVIGAGSIVVKDIPANVIAAGNPCRVIRTL